MKRLAWAGLALGAALLLWRAWGPLAAALGDLDELRGWVERLGVWGPAAIVGLGVLQSLVAPVPGYPITIVSGVLFGTFWGAIYANVGLLLAGAIAAGGTRRFGRPLAERFVARAHLERLQQLLESDSAWLWFWVLLLPTGDLPYYAAGLSRLSLRAFLVVLVAARWPGTFLLTHAASRATTLPTNALLAVMVAMALLGGLAYWQQERLATWSQRWLPRLAPPTRQDAREVRPPTEVEANS